MKLKKPEEIEAAEVQLVPMIDCVFLLLIFFMCAATMAKVDTAFDVDLPEARNGSEQKDLSHRGTVNVLQPGTVTPQGLVVSDAKPYLVNGELADAADLERIMREHLKEDPAVRLYIRADRHVKYAVIRKAMGACAAAGIADVVFAAHPNELEMER